MSGSCVYPRFDKVCMGVAYRNQWNMHWHHYQLENSTKNIQIYICYEWQGWKELLTHPEGENQTSVSTQLPPTDDGKWCLYNIWNQIMWVLKIGITYIFFIITNLKCIDTRLQRKMYEDNEPEVHWVIDFKLIVDICIYQGFWQQS